MPVPNRDDHDQGMGRARRGTKQSSRRPIRAAIAPEVWIENNLMIKVLPPDFAGRYLNFADRMCQVDSLLAMMASQERSVGA